MTDPNTSIAPPTQLRIGLWGPPGSGKTTYLAALKVATYRSRLPGNWIMNGLDPASIDFLTDHVDLLTNRRRFPEATLSVKTLSFRFTGEHTVTERRRFRSPHEIMLPKAFELEVLDVPGGIFNSTTTSNPVDPEGLELPGGTDSSHVAPSIDDLVDRLQECQGIIYLFDPERDANQGDAFIFFHRVLEHLTAQVLQGVTPNRRLPHWVAVCITKFDHPAVFRSARRGGFIRQDANPPYFPRVDDHEAGQLFRKLCEEEPSNSDLVAESLNTHFHPDRIKYFVTTSVGFYVARGRFTMMDPLNVERIGNGSNDFEIRGKVHPINVLEPLLWLHDSVSEER